MKFCILSGQRDGFFAMSNRLEPLEAVDLFLRLTQQCFPGQLDQPLLNELSLVDWVEGGVYDNIIYAGNPDKWIIALAPAFDHPKQQPTLN